jgi:hypothetical protein
VRLPPLPLLLALAAPAAAQPLPADAIEEIVVYLDRQADSSRASDAARFGVLFPDDDVFVLRAENLARVAGLTPREIERLIGRIQRRGVAARWCADGCPTRGGDQTIEFGTVIAAPTGRLVASAEITGHHRRDPREFDSRCALVGWLHEAHLQLVRDGGRWRVVHFSIGRIAEFVGPHCHGRG